MSYFYVYVHRRLDTGDIFYVGKGSQRSRRAYASSGRSKFWKAVGAITAYQVEIIADNLDEQAAFELENQLLIKYSTLCNKKGPQTYRTLTAALFNEFLKYDPSSPSGLRWKYPRANTKDNIAGSYNKITGYWLISVNGIKYPVHRVIWALEKGDVPYNMQINHLDCNPNNNLLTNLELTTAEDNNHKRKMHKGQIAKNNKTGFTGVSLNKAQTRFIVSWRDEHYKLCSRSVSIAHYGYDSAFDLACIFKENADYVARLRRSQQ